MSFLHLLACLLTHLLTHTRKPINFTATIYHIMKKKKKKKKEKEKMKKGKLKAKKESNMQPQRV